MKWSFCWQCTQEIMAKLLRKQLLQVEIGKKKEKACNKFYWRNQDLFSQGKNNEVEVKLKKTKLWYSSLKCNTFSDDFIQNVSKSFQTTNFKRKAHFLVK